MARKLVNDRSRVKISLERAVSMLFISRSSVEKKAALIPLPSYLRGFRELLKNLDTLTPGVCRIQVMGIQSQLKIFSIKRMPLTAPDGRTGENSDSERCTHTTGKINVCLSSDQIQIPLEGW